MKQYSALIIDDSETDRYLLRRDLKSIGHISYVHEAANGKEALDFLTDYEKNLNAFPEKFPPLIIFLDINMPIIDGLKFLDEFKKIKDSYDNYDSIIFMMFTTSELQQEIDQAFSYDFVKEYLVKGNINKALLKEKLDTHLPSHG